MGSQGGYSDLLDRFVYISNDVVTRGYIHWVFIIFVLESMVLQVVQVVLLLVVLDIPPSNHIIRNVNKAMYPSKKHEHPILLHV